MLLKVRRISDSIRSVIGSDQVGVFCSVADNRRLSKWPHVILDWCRLSQLGVVHRNDRQCIPSNCRIICVWVTAKRKSCWSHVGPYGGDDIPVSEVLSQTSAELQDHKQCVVSSMHVHSSCFSWYSLPTEGWPGWVDLGADRVRCVEQLLIEITPLACTAPNHHYKCTRGLAFHNHLEIQPRTVVRIHSLYDCLLYTSELPTKRIV